MVSFAAFIVSLASLFIAWDIWKKSTTHMVKIKKYRPRELNSDHIFQSLDLWVQNIGLRCSELNAYLCVENKRNEINRIHFNYAIDHNIKNIHDSAKNFERGDIILFSLSLGLISEEDFNALVDMDDIKRQKLYFAFYCDGFLFQKIKVFSYKEIFKDIWNKGESFTSKTLKLGNSAKNKESWRGKIKIYRFRYNYFAMNRFIRSVKKHWHPSSESQ